MNESQAFCKSNVMTSHVFACLGLSTDPEISRDGFENLCSAFAVLCTESKCKGILHF